MPDVKADAHPPRPPPTPAPSGTVSASRSRSSRTCSSTCATSITTSANPCSGPHSPRLGQGFGRRPPTLGIWKTRKQPAVTLFLFPVDFETQLAALCRPAALGDEWLHGIKYNGYKIGSPDRGQASPADDAPRRTAGKAALARIVAAARTLGVHDGLLDSEIMLLRPDGRASFTLLRRRCPAQTARPALVYVPVRPSCSSTRDALAALPLQKRKGRAAGAAGRRHSARLRIRPSCRRRRAGLLRRGRRGAAS